MLKSASIHISIFYSILLYDLEADIAETTGVSVANPDVVSELMGIRELCSHRYWRS